ncbi:MAG: ATP-binding protein, partial [Rhodothermales bacterium]|nr:ATP-binding protein [Rhodothermales bacterium]
PCVRIQSSVSALPRHVLVANIDPQAYQSMLLGRLPPGAVAGLVDREGEFLARSIDFEERVGTPGTRYVLDAVKRGGEGIYAGETYEGLVNYSAYATSALTGWSAHVAIDRTLIDGPQTRAVLATMLGVIAAILLAGGMIAYALYDFALRREEERRLLEFQKAEAIGQFTSTTVHDFNNLLAVVDSGLNQIVRGTGEQKTKDMVELIRSAIERGTRLTRQLLRFARLGSQEIGTLDLDALVHGIEDILKRSLGSGVQLDLHIDPGARSVTANADQLELALINLAVNARDAMDGKGRVSIIAERIGDMVEIRVADSGPGIPVDIRHRLFEPLFTTKGPNKGTGLGLAQVASAVRDAGGTVEAINGADGGACFVLRLPAVQVEAARSAVDAVVPDASEVRPAATD